MQHVSHEEIAKVIESSLRSYNNYPAPPVSTDVENAVLVENILRAAELVIDSDDAETRMKSYSKIVNLAIVGLLKCIREEAIRLSDLVPAYAVHPGLMLNDELESRKISIADFSAKTGISAGDIMAMCLGKKELVLEDVIAISNALEMDVDIWLKLQTNYLKDRVRKYFKDNIS